ncbi:RnfABCDGE type electron transport complex subunit D [Sulfobacillus thermosulfidooxidans]|uniref:RnfABCDGE type electron transport complex subunit D n=1 Tax=Sulfobacillus thermosulfidooxidans TaxID=28034 RepID=UPI0006B609BC|nr:RnfABCDGE type electron transport complex subunit D [Sulfobacillus thermosulfidooxidans]
MTRPAKKIPQPSWIRFFKTPKGYVLVALIVLSIIAGIFSPGPQEWLLIFTASATALITEAVIALALHRSVTLSTSALITALIISDVLSVVTPLYLVMLTTVIALGSKHLLKRGRKPFFNPAAFGLLCSLLLFHTPQSWWAALSLLPPYSVLILLIAGIVVAVRVKKYVQVLAFLGTYFSLLLIMALFHVGLPSDTPGDALRVPFVNSALFMAFFMVTDPPTTPSSIRNQIPFSVIVASIAVAIFAVFGGLAYLFIGLLVGNSWTTWMARKKPHVPASQPKQALLP